MISLRSKYWQLHCGYELKQIQRLWVSKIHLQKAFGWARWCTGKWLTVSLGISLLSKLYLTCSLDFFFLTFWLFFLYKKTAFRSYFRHFDCFLTCIISPWPLALTLVLTEPMMDVWKCSHITSPSPVSFTLDSGVCRSVRRSRFPCQWAGCKNTCWSRDSSHIN